MDDPWGSPWAESNSKSTLAPPEPAKSLLSPPPRAFFGATSPGASPWADEADGFGDWAGTSSEQHDQGSASPNWGAWGETSPTRSPTRPSARTHLDPSGKASPLAWPSSALPSPYLSPLPRSRASSTTRQSVSDPWAAELSNHLAKPDALIANSSLDEKESALVNVPESKARHDRAEDTPNSTALPAQAGSEDCSSTAGGRLEHTAGGSSPRSSFANSVDSHRDFERQDSPITPMDDEPRGRLHANTRREPGKVQELVGMYDDLARGTSETPEDAAATSINKALKNPSSTEELGLNISVNSSEQGSEESKPRRKDSSASSVKSATPKAVVVHHAEKDNTSKTTEDHDHLPSFGHTEAVQDILTNFGPLNFQPDMRALENLFPDSSNLSASKTEGPNPEDGVITDSFSEISERKTWYRISRFGSMRKHDLGDDDNNYTRVSWPVTRLHDDTIVIVRRWMEEDSFVGKSILGGNKRSSVFNWDSCAAPVDLSTIYGKKSSSEIARSPTTTTAKRHASQSSVSSQTSTWGKRHSRQSSRADVPNAVIPADAAPSFGWSSSGPAKPNVSFAPPPAAPKPATPKPATTQASETKAPGPARQSPVSKAPISVQPLSLEKARPAAFQDLENEDDDWGDMVASPGIEHSTPVQTDSPFAAPASISTQMKAPAIPSSSLADAWSNDDFSSFEAPIKPANSSSDNLPLVTEKEQPASQSSSAAIAPKQASATPVPQTTTSLAYSPSAPKSALKSTHSAKTSISATTTTIPTQLNDEDLSIAHTIINNLPDLSYMLR